MSMQIYYQPRVPHCWPKATVNVDSTHDSETIASAIVPLMEALLDAYIPLFYRRWMQDALH